MRVKYQSQDGRITVEFDAEGEKALFARLAAVEKVIEAGKCGKCDESRVIHSHRKTKDGHDYYEFRCTACDAMFSFGQYKDGSGLFPKQSEGWHHYEPPSEKTSDQVGDGQGHSESEVGF